VKDTPVKRRNPSGQVVWRARYTDREGRRRYAGTFKLRREAVEAIAAAYDDAPAHGTLGAYAATWIEEHPRGGRTNKSSQTRLNAVLDVEIEGRALRDWLWSELRPKHAEQLIGHLLQVQGRAPEGVRGILRTLSAMAEDAITDEAAEFNFVRGRRVRDNDPRVKKRAVEPRVWSLKQMRDFAAAGRAEVREKTPRPNSENGSTRYFSAVDYEPMLLVFASTSLRVGEVFALERGDVDGDVLHVRGTAYEGVITRGDTAEKRHVRDVPIPPTLGAAFARQIAALDADKKRPDTPLLFPTSSGRPWHYSTFRRDVWHPAQIASGLDIRPHECRHSWITHMRAAGIDPADLAQMSGHDVDTATRVYTKPLGRSMDAVRKLLG
jgi:integrase